MTDEDMVYFEWACSAYGEELVVALYNYLRDIRELKEVLHYLNMNASL